MDKITADRQQLRKFGITMGVAFSVITLLILIRHKHSILPTAVISGIFFVIAACAPQLLKTVYIFWMRLGFVLSWVNTRLILCILFYLVFTPIGLVMRLFGADLLDKRIDKKSVSYWRKNEQKGFKAEDYERQY